MTTSVVDRRVADQPVLQRDGVDVRFGEVHGLQDVDLTVYRAEVLGPSGARKTTLFDLISGVRAPDKGRIRCLGDEVTVVDPWCEARPPPDLPASANVRLVVGGGRRHCRPGLAGRRRGNVR